MYEIARRIAVAAGHGRAARLCLYVNHPHRIGDAEFKPSGLAAAASAGFTLALTLITSNPETARSFTKRHGPVIHKPLWRRCTATTTACPAR
jgi:glutathione synthase/RimK-type ligase-like ATP-grasp enzyme